MSAIDPSTGCTWVPLIHTAHLGWYVQKYNVSDKKPQIHRKQHKKKNRFSLQLMNCTKAKLIEDWISADDPKSQADAANRTTSCAKSRDKITLRLISPNVSTQKRNKSWFNEAKSAPLSALSCGNDDYHLNFYLIVMRYLILILRSSLHFFSLVNVITSMYMSNHPTEEKVYCSYRCQQKSD